MAAASTLARIAKIGNDKSASRQQSLRNGRFDEFRNDLEHPGVHLYFSPTYSSWLNQVEIWFARIEREVIACGVFTSVRDLARKLMRYIRGDKVEGGDVIQLQIVGLENSRSLHCAALRSG